VRDPGQHGHPFRLFGHQQGAGPRNGARRIGDGRGAQYPSPAAPSSTSGPPGMGVEGWQAMRIDLQAGGTVEEVVLAGRTPPT